MDMNPNVFVNSICINQQDFMNQFASICLYTFLLAFVQLPVMSPTTMGGHRTALFFMIVLYFATLRFRSVYYLTSGEKCQIGSRMCVSERKVYPPG